MTKKKKLTIIILLPVLIFVLAVAAVFILLRVELSNAPDPAPFIEEYSAEIESAVRNGGSVTDAAVPVSIQNNPETDEGRRLLEACLKSVTVSPAGTVMQEGRSAEQSIKTEMLDTEKLFSDMNPEINAALAELAAQAKGPNEIYTADDAFKPELVDKIYSDVLDARYKNTATADCAVSSETVMKLEYKDESWQVSNAADVAHAVLAEIESVDYDALAQKIKNKATSELTYIPIKYKIEEDALCGPEPDESRFLVTTDPADIEELLQTEEAKKLIGDRELLWSPDVDSIPGRNMYCYLDETILTISWQQVEARAVGTYSEVIIADGSQLRRRIAGDQFEDFHHITTSEFAEECNGVLTLGGDFYHHGRNCGIVVYNREILRFDPDTCDTCYITPDGDMLFSYRGQFSSIEEAQKFVDDNDILFSLAFGPVLIDDYEDVTPDSYMWGEINDQYARSGLGILDEHHYLAININCEMPDYYYLATLRDLADAMVRAGCEKAYTLDGGQTATTVFNTELINPVQFGWQKPISDVIYFATAVPNE